MLRVSLAVALTLALGVRARAEGPARPRTFVPRAPAPAAPAAPRAPSPANEARVLENGAWRDLERSWTALRAQGGSRGFARGATRVCTRALEWPELHAPRPGLPVLIAQSCGGALSALVSTGPREVASADTQAWQRGFVPYSESGTLDCFALDALAPVVAELPAVKSDASLAQRFAEARGQCGEQTRKAERGREALGLPPCERIAALSELLEAQGKPDWAARHLANASDADELESRWNRLAGRQARYMHVVAYHLSEARIELSSFAERGAAEGKLTPESARELREAFRCLGEFRGAHVRLRELERRLEDARSEPSAR